MSPSTRPLVLVVEDQSMQRVLLREVLEVGGFDVVEAVDGRQALESFEQHKPDIVLLDVRMPIMDGFEVCAELRARASGAFVPILMLTVLGDEESINRAFRAGATDFITKPVVWPILGQRLQYMLRASKAFRNLAESESELARRVIERTESLREANCSLEMANRDLEAFSYSVSHDLRAPLRTIDGYARMLLGNPVVAAHDDIHEPLGRIRNACLRMNQLIDDLLNLSQVGRDELRRRPVDLGALVAEVVNELQHADPARRIKVDVEAGMHASADPGLLRIVLENLIGNAFKFTSGTQDARVQIGQYRNEAGGVTYFVRDNGAGFNPLHADRLFAPFQRLHSSSEFAGTGIGLAIVARVVNRHGGSVRAEGKPGLGATFHFTLGSA